MQKITTCFWFDGNAEEAMHFYISVFKDSKVGKVTRFGESGPGKKGTVMAVSFQLNGQQFMGINGGPEFPFNESISLFVDCESQEEVDYYWNALLAGGKESQCGWLKDKYGVSWQIVPSTLIKLLADPDAAKAARVMQAMLKMKKIDIAALLRAADGK
jgi:predicted 3-demethylubiquinone-9 3-methyltransferase (glyoxalase superfamily)